MNVSLVSAFACVLALSAAACRPGASSPGPTEGTAEAIVQAPLAWAGKRVRVTTTVQPGGSPVCTMKACPANDACCNSCGQPLTAGPGLALRAATGPAFACTGDNCDKARRCSPDDGMRGGRYALVGTVETDLAGKPTLVVESYAKAP